MLLILLLGKLSIEEMADFSAASPSGGFQRWITALPVRADFSGGFQRCQSERWISAPPVRADFSAANPSQRISRIQEGRVGEIPMGLSRPCCWISAAPRLLLLVLSTLEPCKCKGQPEVNDIIAALRAQSSATIVSLQPASSMACSIQKSSMQQ